MEFDYAWLLLAFPLAFALGWLASRLDLRQLRIENRQAPKAYFKGLNFLLNAPPCAFLRMRGGPGRSTEAQESPHRPRTRKAQPLAFPLVLPWTPWKFLKLA